MGKIIILDENTANKIAAGEVIERPASVIKELVENSMDANATNISVEIKNGGIAQMKITDNGTGISEDDVVMAFERHATSKITSAKDLVHIHTMGFRGEALASIASVSGVEVTTKTAESTHGTYVKIQNGVVKDMCHVGCPVGTSITVSNLFYNTPARYKFLKKDSVEAGYISDLVLRMALSSPDISFALTNKGNTVISTPGNNDLLSTIFSLYGKDIVHRSVEVSYNYEGINLSGFVGKPDIARASRNYQSIYINGRYIKSKIITSAIDQAYQTLLMKNKYPFVVLKIDVDPSNVDVNVHPNKMDVRFSEEQKIFKSVYHAIVNTLNSSNLMPEIVLSKKSNADENIYLNEPKKSDYVISRNESNTSTNDQFLNHDNLISSIEKKEVAQQEQEIIKQDIKTKEKKAVPEIHEKLYEVNKQKINIPQNDGLVEEKLAHEQYQMQVEGFDELPVANEKKLPNRKIIGQFLRTYILVEENKELILVDQHAAHERLIYEELKKRCQRKESIAQMMLHPEVIELTSREITSINENKEHLDRAGFIFEQFGTNSIILRSVPYLSEKISDPRGIFLEILDGFTSWNNKDVNVIEDEVLYRVACKLAVKANMNLDETELNNILNCLDNINSRYTCPHGRPIAVKLTKYEIEKMFKRIT